LLAQQDARYNCDHDDLFFVVSKPIYENALNSRSKTWQRTEKSRWIRPALST
jgi:hypothetical protein